MNPLINGPLQPPANAALDDQGVLGAMQSLRPSIGGMAPPDPNMAPVSPDPKPALVSDIPPWQNANPFKDDNGMQHLSYNPDQYGFDGLGGQHVFGAFPSEPAPPPGMSPQPPGDDLAAAILARALQTKQMQQQYQGNVSAQNEQEDLQGLKLNKPAQGY